MVNWRSIVANDFGKEVDEDFRKKRELNPNPSASVLYLWALAVGAVVSGEFSGWNVRSIKDFKVVRTS
jgi:hypothetical protein